MSWSPYELPFQRDKFVQVTRTMYENYAGEQDTEFGDDVLESPLTWLDSDISDLVAETYSTLPEWSLDAVLPGETGFIAFEKSPAIFDVTVPEMSRTVRMSCDGFWWTMAGNEVSVMLITRNQVATAFAPGLPFTLISAFSSSRGNPEYGGGIKIDEEQAKSLVGATWLLMSQPRVVEESDPVVVKRKPRTDRLVSAPIVSVSTRRLTARYRPASTPTGRKAQKRWWVRGHWRQQAWGKNRELRKPVFIAPHTAGNEDAPVESRPQVQVWRKK